jgi:hypothetical protein
LTGGVEPATRVARTTPGSTAIAGWSAGHISVSGGILQAAGADVLLTFDGASVSGQNHGATTFDGALLTGGTEPATRVTVTTEGQTKRNAWGVLLANGVLTGTIPAQTASADASQVTAGSDYRIPGNVINALAKEAAFEDDNNASYYTIMSGLGFDVRAPQVEETGNDTEL